MRKPIEPGCVVQCVNDTGLDKLIRKGRVYTVRFTTIFGHVIYLDDGYMAFNSERFEVLYQSCEGETDFDTEDEGGYEC